MINGHLKWSEKFENITQIITASKRQLACCFNLSDVFKFFLCEFRESSPICFVEINIGISFRLNFGYRTTYIMMKKWGAFYWTSDEETVWAFDLMDTSALMTAKFELSTWSDRSSPRWSLKILKCHNAWWALKSLGWEVFKREWMTYRCIVSWSAATCWYDIL